MVNIKLINHYKYYLLYKYIMNNINFNEINKNLKNYF